MQKEMRSRVSEMRMIFNALQDEVRKLRLVPVAMQLNTLPRIVRDLKTELHKKVQLEIRDNDVKIDKIVLDALKDPIVHILRNSIDHGLEDPKVRKALGKPEEGTILIEVSEEGSQILFKISDDGAGIDVEKVAQTALRKKILTKAELEALSQEEILELIFRPGFSTKETATDVSGRGVGLDAVRSNLGNLKGQVSLTTAPDQGTVFYLRVPLTLATERGLIIKSGGQTFALLTSTIESIRLIQREEIVQVEGEQTITMDPQPVLLCDLTEILEMEKTEKNELLLPALIIKKNWERMALLVDEIIGEREIVLKPLQPPLTNIPFVIGATLSGSNQIIFVLNTRDIINKGKTARRRHDQNINCR
jgi:two-component system, chemotaxis family, sensor kinase CheA